LAELYYKNDDSIIAAYFGTPIADLFHWSREMALSGKADFRKLIKLTEAFHRHNKIINSSYIMSLIDPFKYNYEVRIPSPVPVPTAAFCVQRNTTLTTNNKGNVAFAFSPFFLASTNISSCAINNNDLLTGSGSSPYFNATDFGQTLPLAFYTRYRLTSAAVRITFTSSSLNSTGFCTMSVDFDQCRSDIMGNAITAYSKYGNFAQIENGFYKQTRAVNNGVTMQVNYLPTDTASQEFYNIGNLPNGYVIVGYITGAPASTTVARIDTVFNFEAFVSQEFSDYIPSKANDNIEDPDECRMFINNCHARKFNTPEDMPHALPIPINIADKDKIPEVPGGQVDVITPVAADKMVDKIKDIGKEIITVIVDDKLKNKPIAQRLDIADKVKDKFLKVDVFDSPNALRKVGPAAGGLLAGGLLGTILGIGSKLLPSII